MLITKHLNIIDRILLNKNEDLEYISNLEIEEKENQYIHNRAFKTAFQDYLENEEEIDFSETTYSEYELYGTYYGLELAKYKIFLLGLLNPEPQKTEKIQTTLAQQILTLEYLGIVKMLTDKCNTSEAKYEIISLITGKSKDNVKKALQKKVGEHIKKKSVKQYLENLSQVFEKMGLITESKEIKKDIDK